MTMTQRRHAIAIFPYCMPYHANRRDYMPIDATCHAHRCDRWIVVRCDLSFDCLSAPSSHRTSSHHLTPCQCAVDDRSSGLCVSQRHPLRSRVDRSDSICPMLVAGPTIDGQHGRFPEPRGSRWRWLIHPVSQRHPLRMLRSSDRGRVGFRPLRFEL